IVDASTLTDADMDITMIDQYIATMTKHGSTLAFANKTAEVEAANKGFFDALRARGIAVTSNTEKPEEEEAIAA
ncbi:MAG: hypothetical protein QF793_03040, partial [Candidatus Peribacteraceae bacterium]|nr:hypothetical protein [Candidatus Peribacteraceae bacterium]